MSIRPDGRHVSKLLTHLQTRVKPLQEIRDELQVDEWFMQLEKEVSTIGVPLDTIITLLPSLMEQHLIDDINEIPAENNWSYETWRDTIIQTMCPSTEIPYDTLVNELRLPSKKEAITVTTVTSSNLKCTVNTAKSSDT